MGKWRNLEKGSAQGGLEVLESDSGEEGPWCPHGPMLLFGSARGKFYACSCSRRAECISNIIVPAWAHRPTKKLNLKYRTLSPRYDKEKSRKTYLEASDGGNRDVLYCTACDVVCALTSECTHATHEMIRVTPKQALHPSDWLPPLHRDTTHAQYHFTEKSIDTIIRFLFKNNKKYVICLGTPTLHEALREQGANSLLLDLDARYRHVCSPQHFLHYNMFNHHFFDASDRELFYQFMESAGEAGVCVVLDPPFGGRVEPLARTLHCISADRARTLRQPESLVDVVWVFPYFAEPHITNLLPHVYMHHYQVTYRNHGKLSGSRRSPVRLFSSLPRASLRPHPEQGYHWCAACDEWVPDAVTHCTNCASCTGRDGRAYVHCLKCARCVKPTYRHCYACERCCLPDHLCGLPPPVQSCYNCKKKGHKRIDCPLLEADTTQKNKRKRK